MNVRKTLPESGNKYYNGKSSGGYSSCIQGSPTCKGRDRLANCVGYCDGAVNEQAGKGKEVYPLNCNAELFIERGLAYGMSCYKNPEVGDCLVWQKGATLNGSDGAGHVAMCIDVLERNSQGIATKIRTAESGYGSSTIFWTTIRSNTNGNWGQASSYKYRGALRLPGVNPNPTPTPTPQPTPSNKFVVGEKVWIEGPLYLSANATTPNGYASKRVTTITRKVDGTANPYNTTGDLGWMKEANISKYYEQPKPTPAPSNTLEEGNKVKIIGTGKGSCDGSGGTAYGLGWERVILKVYDGKPYPYRIGNSNGTTGYYKAEALKKL